MHKFLARSTIAIVLGQQLLSPAFVFSQQDTRPKQTQTSVVWKAPTTQTVVSFDQLNELPAKEEPTIRVALATNARSATISTGGHLMRAGAEATTLVALDLTRVRIEPRLLSPLTPGPITQSEHQYQLQLAGLLMRGDAEQKSQEVQEASGVDSQIAFNTQTKTWELHIGSPRSQADAEELRARLEDAGLDVVVTPRVGAPTPANASNSGTTRAKSLAANNATQTSARRVPAVSTVRPASRLSMPSREVVAFSAGAKRLFSSSAPVTFGSDNEATPVRYNDRPYRGRIEVFTNNRGALTVVNVIGLEDYVKGVVPNELSAASFNLMEAQKAQAIAARTYALRNRGQFMSQGYDILPTTRSQVYRGLASENPLSSRAVDETRGIVATYNGEPINALYTSTCGGRTEDSQNIFNDALPYIKGRECAADGAAALAPFIIKTSREPAEPKEEQNVPVARDVALLAILNFTSLRARVTDAWASANAPASEVRSWLASVSRLTHQITPTFTDEVVRPPAFATALSIAVFGESRAATLLNDADVAYFLAMRDAGDIPAGNRADVALLVRDGYMSVLPDATLRPREPISRARALHSIARILEARGLLQLQKGTTRPTADGTLVLRNSRGKDQPVKVTADSFLFRQIGETVYSVRSVALVGGESVIFHVNAAGVVDYLEVRPAPNGAAADRSSQFTNWTTELSLGQVQSRLGRAASGIGSLVDLRVVSRGRSRRATDVAVIGTVGTGHIQRGRIRSALGLREQLFVIERKYDESGRVTGFTFIGRGLGHGLGMCQVGAYGLARQGFTAEQILKAYYTGIELTRIY